jgi:hypothetical protein
MTRAGRGLNFTMSDGSVRALQPTTLASLALGLPRSGGAAQAIAWGSELAAARALLAGLQRQGVPTAALTVRPAQDPLPVLLVIADGRDLMKGQALLFLVADEPPSTALLLPAVQCAREAARRATRGGGVSQVLAQSPPGPRPLLPTDSMSFNFSKIEID